MVSCKCLCLGNVICNKFWMGQVLRCQKSWQGRWQQQSNTTPLTTTVLSRASAPKALHTGGASMHVCYIRVWWLLLKLKWLKAGERGREGLNWSCTLFLATWAMVGVWGGAKRGRVKDAICPCYPASNCATFKIGEFYVSWWFPWNARPMICLLAGCVSPP